jgi:CRISPR-associated protein Csy2
LTSGPQFNGLLIVPHLRVQNANAISSSLTWGFPSITAFLGLMWALERKTSADCQLAFQGVGVISHSFTPLVALGGYPLAFRLTRNPVDDKGESSAIVEEGRAHMEISLVFAVFIAEDQQNAGNLKFQAGLVQNALAGLRVAGGTILPPRAGLAPFMELMPSPGNPSGLFHKIRGRGKLVPGFALVARPDLLPQKMKELAAVQEDDSLLEAWLDWSRLNWRAEKNETAAGETEINWKPARQNKGWIVPIPVGYAALTGLYEGGRVKNARDATTPFRFVESLYSLGEWVGVHRLRNVEDLIWYGRYDEPGEMYLARNDYIQPSQEV